MNPSLAKNNSIVSKKEEEESKRSERSKEDKPCVPSTPHVKTDIAYILWKGYILPKRRRRSDSIDVGVRVLLRGPA